MEILRKTPNHFPFTENLKPAPEPFCPQGSQVKVRPLGRNQSAFSSPPAPYSPAQDVCKAGRPPRSHQPAGVEPKASLGRCPRGPPFPLPPLTFCGSICPFSYVSSPLATLLPLGETLAMTWGGQAGASGHRAAAFSSLLGPPSDSLPRTQLSQGAKPSPPGNSWGLPLGVEPRGCVRATD